MLTFFRDSLETHPIVNITASLSGYLISLSEFIHPALGFLILLFSTSTAISVAYIQFNKARRLWYGKENPSKKDDSNTG